MAAQIPDPLHDPIHWRWEARDPARRSGWELLRWPMNEAGAARWATDNGHEIRRVDGSRQDRREDPVNAGRPAQGPIGAGEILRIPAYYWYRDPAWKGQPDAWSFIHVDEDSIAFMRGETVTREDEREAILCADLIGPVAIFPPSF